MTFSDIFQFVSNYRGRFSLLCTCERCQTEFFTVKIHLKILILYQFKSLSFEYLGLSCNLQLFYVSALNDRLAIQLPSKVGCIANTLFSKEMFHSCSPAIIDADLHPITYACTRSKKTHTLWTGYRCSHFTWRKQIHSRSPRVHMRSHREVLFLYVWYPQGPRKVLVYVLL